MTSTNNQRDYYTPQEAADLRKISLDEVWHMLESGQLTALAPGAYQSILGHERFDYVILPPEGVMRFRAQGGDDFTVHGTTETKVPVTWSPAKAELIRVLNWDRDISTKLIPWPPVAPMLSAATQDTAPGGGSVDAPSMPADSLTGRKVTTDDKSWETKARARAVEIIERQRKLDLYPAQLEVADEIAKEFRRDGVKGASKKPMSGGYIKRHALKGILSGLGRQVSTSIRRGK